MKRGSEAFRRKAAIAADADGRQPLRSLVSCVILAVLGAAYPARACDRRCVVVSTFTVTDASYVQTRTLTGTVAAKFTSDIAFRISGRIARRRVEVGDHVGADQILATLDPAEQRANLASAEAALGSAQALLIQARTTFNRQSDLFARGFTTRPAFDKAQQDLRTRQAAVASAEATVGTAREQLAYTALEPGVTGIVVARDAESGQVVEAGQTVFTIAQDGPRDAVFDVYEALLTRPPAGGTLSIRLEADPRIRTTGRLREISPSVDPQAGTVRVKVALADAPAGMSLGASVTGTGSFAPEPATVLPRAALFRWHGRPAVWLVDPRTHVVDPRPVTIKRFGEDTLVLTDRLEPGVLVVKSGTQLLYPGQVVDIASQGGHP